MRTRLTKKQATALLVTTYHELESIFSGLDKLKTLRDGTDGRKKLLQDLKSIITNDLNYDLQNTEIYDLFGPQ